MKLEIYEEKPEDAVEQVVRLQLVQDGKEVDINVVDANGNHERHLVSFCEDGSLHRYPGVGNLGFLTNSNGRIKVIPSDE